MQQRDNHPMIDQACADRRGFIGGAGALIIASALATPAHANAMVQGLGLGSILGKASDGALNKLAKPGAYYDDKDIRLGLPLVGKVLGSNGGGRLGRVLGSVLGGGGGENRADILSGLTRTINDAAGAAAGEAKPIFRGAIDELSFDDVPGIAKQQDGGTRYLRQSSNDALHLKLDPLVDTALGDLGAHRQLDDLNAKYEWLSALGINRQGLNKSVTDQGLDGIFTYMGREEIAFRKNPLGGLGGVGRLLKDIF